jgi:hypothetical protein
MRLLVVVHLATLGLDDREAAFAAMPQWRGWIGDVEFPARA